MHMPASPREQNPRPVCTEAPSVPRDANADSSHSPGNLKKKVAEIQVSESRSSFTNGATEDSATERKAVATRCHPNGRPCGPAGAMTRGARVVGSEEKGPSRRRRAPCARGHPRATSNPVLTHCSG